MLERKSDLQPLSGGEVETKSPAKTWKRKSVRMIKVFLIGYGLVVAAVVVFQRRMLYFPERFTATIAETKVKETGFVAWRNMAGEIVGWKMPATGVATASVLITHGNGGSAMDRGWIAETIQQARNVDVYVLEYPGYGARGGSPGKDSFLMAGEEAFGLLPTDKPRFVVGESLGTGVAAHLAGKFPDSVAGIVFLVPYHSLPWVAQRKMPLVPAYVLLRDRFQPSESLRAYRGPVKVIIAENDEVIPPEAGHRLFESYGGPKELEVISGAQHNDVVARTVAWWKEVFAFLEKNRPAISDSASASQSGVQ